MAVVQRLDKLIKALGDKAAQAVQDCKLACVVGYTQEYAIYVHERLDLKHPVGQAKFLEQPAREMRDELGTTIAESTKGGMPVSKALLLAGLKLQAASQKLCPVDTGALKGSAFTNLEPLSA